MQGEEEQGKEAGGAWRREERGEADGEPCFSLSVSSHWLAAFLYLSHVTSPLISIYALKSVLITKHTIFYKI
jgi:hypothetical protein